MIWKGDRLGTYMHNVVFRGCELDTPTLNFYFKRVTVDYWLHMKITKGRHKLGYIK